MEESNKRKCARFNTEIKTSYRIDGEKTWKECTIVNMSREGMGILFRTKEEIVEGAVIHLKVVRPHEKEPINIKANLRWIAKSGNEYVGGIEWQLTARADIIE